MTAEELQNTFLREKTLENYTDNEIIELILTAAGACKNIPEITGSLLDTFGSLKGILEARPDQLMTVNGMTKRNVTMISMIIPMTRIVERCYIQNQNRLKDQIDTARYCKSLVMGERNEQFYVIALNSRSRVIGTRKIAEGTLSEVNSYPRKVIETAINYNASGIVLCHNHPGGTNFPSREDVSSTLIISKALKPLGIPLFDHIIVAGTQTYSMNEHGDLNDSSPSPTGFLNKKNRFGILLPPFD